MIPLCIPPGSRPATLRSRLAVAACLGVLASAIGADTSAAAPASEATGSADLSVRARPSSLAERYAAEQARLAELRRSPAAEDARELADRLTDGTMAGPDNPLRRPDVEGAARVLRGLVENGEQSPATVLRYGRLLVRLSDGEALSRLEPLLRAAMFAGSGDAAYVLAIATEAGLIGAPREAEPLLQSASVMGNVAALSQLAGLGELGATSGATALEALGARAPHSPEAALALADIHARGLIAPPDREAADYWFAVATASGEAKAMVRRAAFLREDDTPAHRREALRLLRAAADAGSGAAALALGQDVATGGTLGVGMEEGRTWLRRALEIELAGAAFDLSMIDLRIALDAEEPSDIGLARVERAIAPIASDAAALARITRYPWDERQAERMEAVLLPLLELAALKGSIAAGMAYDAWLEADGGRMPRPVAFALVEGLRKDIARRNAEAHVSLARLMLDARLPDGLCEESEAIDLLFAAADLGNGQAMLRIAQMYAYGDRLARSTTFARQWFDRADRQRIAAASWELAELLAASDDPAERHEAEVLYQRKLAEGDDRAAVALAALYARHDRLDDQTLARLRASAPTPESEIAFAEILSSQARPERKALAKRMLAPLAGNPRHPEALVLLARLQLAADADPEEQARGLEALRTASEHGVVPAQVELASFYLGSKAYEDHAPEAVALLKTVLEAEPRNVPARLALATAYFSGRGIGRSSTTAAGIIAAIGADQLMDIPTTLLEANRLAFAGKDGDPDEGIRLLEVQAMQGSLAAERALGLLYLSNFSTRQDPDLAAGLLYRSAQGGDREAMAAMGHLLINGLGVPKATQAGLASLEASAMAGNAAAMYDLSRVYALGMVGRLDQAESRRWLQRAALVGHPSAAFQLGLSYLEGDGVPKDRTAALIWFKQAGRNGSLLAQRTYETLLDANRPGGAKSADTSPVE